MLDIQASSNFQQNSIVPLFYFVITTVIYQALKTQKDSESLRKVEKHVEERNSSEEFLQVVMVKFENLVTIFSVVS